MKFALLLFLYLTLGLAADDDSFLTKSDSLIDKYNEVLIKALKNLIYKQRESLEKCAQLNAENIQKLKEEIADLHAQNDVYSKGLDKIANTKVYINSEFKNQLFICDNFKEELTAYNATIEEQAKLIILLKSQVISKNKQIVKLNYQEKQNALKMKSQLEMCKSLNLKATSCLAFGNSSGIHEITIPDFDSFSVLCDSQTVSPGWTVIQRRIDGKINFQRNWAEYRDGFGSLDGEFFMGLEKIHRLTTSSRHELYVQMRALSGIIKIAHYDNFVVGGEDEQYTLQNVGVAFGNVTKDCLKELEGQKFSTFDRDNDEWMDGKCAEDFNGGWWYNMCACCNLNGKFGKGENGDIFWDDTELDMVKILMRPLKKT
ncbi:ficolin-1-like [Drosophila innubila]|uniref:ficolin-1-like n=1 Tax=Drosophila innubila TaxID=198719 RepID=UPI00148B8282|nr:ficolin-1-like [Drosophila innubila]